MEIFCACSVNVLREEEGLRREGLETRLVSVELEKVRILKDESGVRGIYVLN